MHFAIVMSPIIAKFCFASSFVPDLEANFMVTGFPTRDKKYYWWSLFSQTFKWLLVFIKSKQRRWQIWSECNENIGPWGHAIGMIITKQFISYWLESTENADNLAHPDFRLRHNTVSIRWVYGMFLIYPYLIARLWVLHCNTVYDTEYAMNAKTQ